MSKKNGRKLFSQKDGTTFIEDIHDISDDVKAFFHAIPPRLKRYIADATDIVDFIEKVNDALADGQPLDAAIDFVLAQIPGSADEAIYEWIKQFLSDLPNEIAEIEDKLITASEILFGYADEADFTQIESDTITQLAVYFYKG